MDNKGPWGHIWMALVTNVVGVSTLIDYWLKIGTSAGIFAADSHDKPPWKLMKRIHLNSTMANDCPSLFPMPSAKLTLALMRYAQTFRWTKFLHLAPGRSSHFRRLKGGI
jgi:hypothetical protein